MTQAQPSRMSVGQAKALLAMPDLLILDTETTSLEGYLVQIAILRANDNAVLLDTYVDPQVDIEPAAAAVHGITADLVMWAPKFAELESMLRGLLFGRPVAIYKASFDTSILGRELLRLRGANYRDWWLSQVFWIDTIQMYAAYVGEYNEYHGSYRYQKLPSGDHSAIGDCRACLAVLRRMAADTLQLQAVNGGTW